jgi:hypothetical protein
MDISEERGKRGYGYRKGEERVSGGRERETERERAK